MGSGAGLTGGPITGSGKLSIASGGVTNSMLANPSLTVAAGTDLTGGGTVALGGTTTLNLDTTKVPLLNAANTFTGNQTVNGNLSATGVVTGSSYQIGSNLFAFGSFSNFNAFLGFAGNTATTGTGNTANGVAALQTNTTGSNNTASGAYALDGNSGSNNTVIGFQAIYGQGTGSFNTALGALSGLTNDSSDMTGTNNTFIGIGTAISTGTVSNATAIGANADVTESNALVLGSINGVNGATASTNVGIGTTAPLAALDVAGGGGVRTFIGSPNCGSFAGIGFGASGFNSCQNYSVVGDGTNTFIAAPTGQILFRVDKNAYTAMFIGSSGAVGIGTLSPDSSLSVNGNADKTGGGSWGTFSDGRLKNLNGNFNTGLSQVLKIHPVRYRYKADNAHGPPRYGGTYRCGRPGSPKGHPRGGDGKQQRLLDGQQRSDHLDDAECDQGAARADPQAASAGSAPAGEDRSAQSAGARSSSRPQGKPARGRRCPDCECDGTADPSLKQSGRAHCPPAPFSRSTLALSVAFQRSR